MKTLYVLRHTKASSDDGDLRDIDRPLAGRGERDAARIAAHLAAEKISPNVVCCSPAVRTRALLEVLRPALRDPQVTFDDVLYGASVAELRALVRTFGDDVARVMIIGHNPGLGDLVFTYSGEAFDFPTGALATLEMAKWSSDQASLRAMVVPKQLG